MATRSNTRARFLGVALAPATTSSAQTRLSSFIGEAVIQRGVQVRACIRRSNKGSMAAEPQAESRPPP